MLANALQWSKHEWSSRIDATVDRFLKAVPATKAAADACPPDGWYECFHTCEYRFNCALLMDTMVVKWILPIDQQCPATSTSCDYACICNETG